MDFDELERLRRRRKPALPEAAPPTLGRLEPQKAAAPTIAKAGDPGVSLALDLAAGLVVVLLFGVPFWSGGNLPLVWGATGFVAAGALAACQAMIAWRDPARAPLLAGLRGPFRLALAMPVFAVAQMLLPGPGAEPAAAISLGPEATALGLVRLASAAMVFVLVAAIAANRRRAMRFAWALFAVAVAHASWALAIGGTTGGITGGTSAGITGGFANHNSFAAFAGMGLILGVALVVEDRRRGAAAGGNGVRLAERALLWLALAVLALAIVASGSRLGAVSALCGTLVVLALLGLGPLRAALAVCGAAVAALALGGGGLIERAILIGPATQTRAELFAQVAGMIRARPLTGWGLDSFPLAFEQAHRPPLSSGLVWDHAHNSYLSLWAEMGLLAGSAPLVALVWCAVRLWKGLGATSGGGGLAVAALGVLMAEAIHALGDFSLEIAGNLYFFLAVLALGLAGRPHGSRQESQ